MNYITVGVYANNTYKVNIVKLEDIGGHIVYNKTYRPGRALFVDGECVNKGYLNKEQIEEWTNKIKEMNIDSSIASEVYI